MRGEIVHYKLVSAVRGLGPSRLSDFWDLSGRNFLQARTACLSPPAPMAIMSAPSIIMASAIDSASYWLNVPINGG